MKDDDNLNNFETPRDRFKRLLKNIETQIGIDSDPVNHKKSRWSMSFDGTTEKTSDFRSENLEYDSGDQNELDDTAPVKFDTKPNGTKVEEDTIPYVAQKTYVPSRSNQAATYPPRHSRRFIGCIGRIILAIVFILVLLGLCAASFGLYQYYQIASALPDISDLRQRASQFETTRILDRNGNILYEILDPNAGRRTYVPLDKISPFLVAATVATEDKGFYSHPGFDPMGIVRAFLQNYQGGGIVSGASTITQQLARTLIFSPEERFEQSYNRKIREAILATEITRRYTKDEILELYLNEIYYGNLAYGVQAAAETYFNTTADKLTIGQAAFLAGLPQAPAVYDVYTNADITFSRLEDVLVLMYQSSQEQGCIYVSNNSRRICLSPVEITNAAVEIRNFDFESPDVEIRSPHWVTYIRSLLEEQYDAQTIYRSGFTVYTTLDPALQSHAEKSIKDQLKTLENNNANDAALVAIRPTTGEILAMVGSSDFFNEDISGQVNMATSPRQPGSAMKPITYLAAFEKGWTPATLLWDVPSEFPPSGSPDDPRPAYKPVNYDGKYHGPVTIRTALANSYNVPAVKALEFIGIYDDPSNGWEDGFISMAQRLGINSLNQHDYGLSLTLGGGEVTLLELTNAYATIANNGRLVPPVAITRILDHNGELIYDYEQPAGLQVIRTEHAYLISSILSDNEARTPAMGADSVLNLPFPAASKTGTTNDFRDSITMGYTPDLSVGVWVGNADYTPMNNVSGLQGAAPIWGNFMELVVPIITGDQPSSFIRPGGIVERVICSISGTEPSKWCPDQRNEFFAADQLPLPKEEDLWKEILIDTWTELKASPECSEYTEEEFVLNVIDPWAKKWLKQDPHGIKWAKDNGFPDKLKFTPPRECTANDPRPVLEFTSPKEYERITSSPLGIYGAVDATDWFKFVSLEYGIGEEPEEWETLAKGNERINRPELLYTWDLADLPEGLITLRLLMESTEDTFAEKLLLVNIQVPTPTPTPTNTPTPTPTFTPTATFTLTPTFTSTPSLTPIPTDTPEPSVTPTEKQKTPKNTNTPKSTSVDETPVQSLEETPKATESEETSPLFSLNPLNIFQKLQVDDFVFPWEVTD